MRQHRSQCRGTNLQGNQCGRLEYEHGAGYCSKHLPSDVPVARQAWPKSAHGSLGEGHQGAIGTAREIVRETANGQLTPRDEADAARKTAKLVQRMAAERVVRVFEVWDTILNDDAESGAVRAQVGEKIIDRAAGKPGQHLDIEVGVAEWLAHPTDATDDDDIVDAEDWQ